MADVKISALPSGTALTGPEVAPFVQAGNTVKITADQITTFVRSALVASPTTIDSIPDPLDPADDEFDSVNFPTETVLDTTGTRFPGATPWAWRNQGDAQANITQGACVLLAPDNASDNVRMVEQDAPVGSWKYRCQILGAMFDILGTSTFGMSVANDATGGILAFGCYLNPFWAPYWLYYNDPTALTAFAVANGNIYIQGGGSDNVAFPMYIEIESNGTTLFWRYSASGLDDTFFLFAEVDIADHLLAVDKIGFMVNPSDGFPGSISVGWFRRVA